MLRNVMNEKFDKMSYEEQKQFLKELEDKEVVQYDDNCALEVVVEALVNGIVAIVKLFK